MIKALHRQTLTDIATQYLGSADAAYDIAVLNGLSVTDDIVPGTELIMPAIVNAEIVSYYVNKGIQPATALVAQAELIQSIVDTFVIIQPVQSKHVAIVLEGQNLVDIATQYCGSGDVAYDIALLNDLSVTDELEAGSELSLPAITNKKIAEYYKNKGLQPATGYTMNSVNPLPTGLEGIGNWAIETEFIIS